VIGQIERDSNGFIDTFL